ncbi:MAG TPA: IPT/TIG domain-containing protein, partial [Myxococcota bacterium]|nr:IPT/TIG domain-containing protein [Myxococcota bacterium]
NKTVFPYSCDLDPLTIITCPTNQDTQCLKNKCEPASGECSMLPASEGQTCTFVSICVLQATCQEGLCAPFVTRNCDDGNECTDDVCVEELGCVRTNNSSPCDDGSVCTLDDTCIDGACGHLNVLDCDNGVFCDGVELCDPALGCYAGTPPTCDDGNACTRDRCLDFYDECFNDWIETAVEGPRGALSCQDGVDNDCDGKTDISDPECLLGLDRVEPNDGVMAGGDMVVLTGNELDEVTTVLFGTRQAQILEQSSLSMTVVTPAGQTPGPVSVVVSSGLASYTMVNGFTYTAAASPPGGECTLLFPDSALERDVGASIVVMTGESIVPTTTPSEMVMFSFGHGPRG